MGYRTGLVAVDLPEESSQVLDAAGLVTDRNSATLQLLTVIKPLIQVYGGLDMAPIAMGTVSFEDEARGQARQQLVNPAGNQAVAEDNVPVVTGIPSREIKKLAASLHADLIVVGSHGRQGLGPLLGHKVNKTQGEIEAAMRLCMNSTSSVAVATRGSSDHAGSSLSAV